ncbi:hypothetical protein F5148DRAFT_1292475 [Russula earlei]|uniref:Uncharacterized protein n=1 Tax=Russula earlei TaxID=71964 RepID=A0ACC0TTX7_9AGAM|nr:hypothetical protein F5148DRAFT_1292475 [Russula earlei]
MATTKKNTTTFNEHLDKRYGKRGTEERTEFEIKAKAFLIGEVIKEERRLAKLTQEQLADKIGAKKSFISRIENGQSDIQLSTLYRLLEFGLASNRKGTIPRAAVRKAVKAVFGATIEILSAKPAKTAIKMAKKPALSRAS